MSTRRTYESFPNRRAYETYLSGIANKKEVTIMTNAQYSDLVQAAGNIRAAVMRKEMGDEGWDLRDEVLALQEIVSQLATVVYQNRYIASEDVRVVRPIEDGQINGYGLCPHCLGNVFERERRPNGNDKCVNGHVFPSKATLPGQ